MDADGKGGYAENELEYYTQFAQAKENKPVYNPNQDRLEQSFEDVTKFNWDYGNMDLTHDAEGKPYLDNGFDRRIYNDPNTGQRDLTFEEYNHIMKTPSLYQKLKSKNDAIKEKEKQEEELFKLSPNELRKRVNKSSLETQTPDQQLAAMQEHLAGMVGPEHRDRVATAFNDFWQNVLGPTIGEGVVQPFLAGPPMVPGMKVPKTKFQWPESFGQPRELPKKTLLSSADYPHVEREFKAAVESGKSNSQTALKQELGISWEALRRLEKNAGINLEDTFQRSVWTPERVEQAKKLLSEGSYSKQDIAERLGIHKNTLNAKLEELGFSPRNYTARENVTEKTLTADLPEQARKVAIGNQYTTDWTPESIAKLHGLYKEGKSFSEIGDILGMSRSKVAGKAFREGLSGNPQWNRIPQERLDRIKAAYENNENISALARELGVPKSTIRSVIERQGFKKLKE